MEIALWKEDLFQHERKCVQINVKTAVVRDSVRQGLNKNESISEKRP